MLIFVSIAIASFVLVTGAFVFHHDHDFGHDLAHDFDHGSEVGGEHTISLFSVKVIGTLTMGFGAAGAIARYYNVGYPGSSVIGVFCGLFLAAMMYGMLSLIVRQQASSLISASSLVGASGTVTAPIVADSLGEVSVSYAGQYSTYSAKSRDGKDIPKGRTVRVVEAVGSQLTVEEVHV